MYYYLLLCFVVEHQNRERNIPVVSEKWLVDSIQKQQAQPLDAYDVVSDLIPEGRGIPWDKMDPNEEALESLTAQVSCSCFFFVWTEKMISPPSGIPTGFGSSSCMERGVSTRIACCRSKEGSYLRRMESYTTMRSPFVIRGGESTSRSRTCT